MEVTRNTFQSNSQPPFANHLQKIIRQQLVSIRIFKLEQVVQPEAQAWR